MNTDNCASRSVRFKWWRSQESEPTLYIRKTPQRTTREDSKAASSRQKQVVHHENSANLSRCPVWLFKLYKSLCPQVPKENAFYLQPLKKPCWFLIKPVGHNSLTTMVKEMCKAAGITGFRMNHSLRATTTTRLYRAGVDEQLIMDGTGHRSLDGVRSYKRTSKEQLEVVSDIANLSAPEPKKQKTLNPHTVPYSHGTQQMGVAPAQISLQNCSNITFNITYGQV